VIRRNPARPVLDVPSALSAVQQPVEPGRQIGTWFPLGSGTAPLSPDCVEQGSGLDRARVEPEHLSSVRAVVDAPAIRVGHMVLAAAGCVPPRQRMLGALRRIDNRRVVLEDRPHVRRSRLRRMDNRRAGRAPRTAPAWQQALGVSQVTPAYADCATDQRVRRRPGRWGEAVSMTRRRPIIDDSVESPRHLIRPRSSHGRCERLPGWRGRGGLRGARTTWCSNWRVDRGVIGEEGRRVDRQLGFAPLNGQHRG